MPIHPVHHLPSELLESILLRVVDPHSCVKLVSQDLACTAFVCKEWHTIVVESCWKKLLEIRLDQKVSCKGDEALWLLQYLREESESVFATKAKSLFKSRDKDLEDVRCFVAIPFSVGQLRKQYRVADLVNRAIEKHGSITAFQEHIWKLLDRAQKAAKTSFERGVARQAAAAEALETFGKSIRSVLQYDVGQFVRRNKGSLEAITRRASQLQHRREDLQAILEGEGIPLNTLLLGHDGLAYERGVISRGEILDKVARLLALKGALEAKGLRGRMHNACREYVQHGGDLADLVDKIEIESFYRERLYCMRMEDRALELQRYMEGLSVEQVLSEVPMGIQVSALFSKVFNRVFAVKDVVASLRLRR